MANILADIMAYKREQVAMLKKQHSLASMKNACLDMPAPRDFCGAIKQKQAANNIALIAEIKKASPSQGIIRQHFNPNQHAVDYERAGACCLSILTEDKWFQGNISYINMVKNTCSLPILRKDFMVDIWQIYESRLHGADAILLILAGLNDDEAHAMEQVALSLNMAVLIETHDADEVTRANAMQSPLIGVNNRNLKTLHVSLAQGKTMLPLIAPHKIAVAESGIHSHSDIHDMQLANAHAFLVGESLMRCDDIYEATRVLLGAS